MIKVVRRATGRYAPMVICDQCGEAITDCRDGNVEYKADRLGTDAFTGEPFFTHKECSEAFESARGGLYVWWATELGAWLVWLLDNAKANTPDVRDNAEELERI